MTSFQRGAAVGWSARPERDGQRAGAQAAQGCAKSWAGSLRRGSLGVAGCRRRYRVSIGLVRIGRPTPGACGLRANRHPAGHGSARCTGQGQGDADRSRNQSAGEWLVAERLLQNVRDGDPPAPPLEPVLGPHLDSVRAPRPIDRARFVRVTLAGGVNERRCCSRSSPPSCCRTAGERADSANDWSSRWNH
jgi:hypothetical protein